MRNNKLKTCQEQTRFLWISCVNSARLINHLLADYIKPDILCVTDKMLKILYAICNGALEKKVIKRTADLTETNEKLKNETNEDCRPKKP